VSQQGVANKDIAQGGKVTGLMGSNLANPNRFAFNDVSSLCPMRRFAETGTTPHRLPSGPLHDAAEVARTGVPTIMMFAQSLHGISHNKMEDMKEEHLELAIIAFDKFAEKATQWIATR
jgi:hypothetical protein